MSAANSSKRILVVDDDLTYRRLLEGLLTHAGYRTIGVATARAAVASLRHGKPALVLLDRHLGDGDGLDVLDVFRAEAPELPVVILSGDRDPLSFREASRRGARHYLTKPVDPTSLERTIQQALSPAAPPPEPEPEPLPEVDLQPAPLPLRPSGVSGNSPPMLELLARIGRCGPAVIPVLLTTEPGTDLHAVARAIHDQSPRKHEPFNHLHVSGCGPERQEHDLFGYEKGSFEGALARRVGLWEVSRKGTLFLQDVEDLTPPMQAKLLNAMRLGTFRRVGGWDPVPAQTRLVASASVDLRERVEQGRFRQDLFYALSVYELQVPPLRVRGTDVVALARQRLIQLADARGLPIPRLSADVVTVLQTYPWPGNHQELEAAMMRALVETGATGMVFTEHLPERMTRVETASDLGRITTGQLTQLMDRHAWNLQAVANDLDLTMDELLGVLRNQGLLGGRTG